MNTVKTWWVKAERPKTESKLTLRLPRLIRWGSDDEPNWHKIDNYIKTKYPGWIVYCVSLEDLNEIDC